MNTEIASLCFSVAETRALREFAKTHPRLVKGIEQRRSVIEMELRRLYETRGHEALLADVIEGGSQYAQKQKGRR